MLSSAWVIQFRSGIVSPKLVTTPGWWRSLSPWSVIQFWPKLYHHCGQGAIKWPKTDPSKHSHSCTQPPPNSPPKLATGGAESMLFSAKTAKVRQRKIQKQPKFTATENSKITQIYGKGNLTIFEDVDMLCSEILWGFWGLVKLVWCEAAYVCLYMLYRFTMASVSVVYVLLYCVRE